MLAVIQSHAEMLTILRVHCFPAQGKKYMKLFAGKLMADYAQVLFHQFPGILRS